MNPPRSITSARYFYTLNLIYVAQVGALTLFGALSYYLAESGLMGKSDHNLALTLQRIVVWLVPMSIPAGYLIFRMMVKSIPGHMPLHSKMQKYFRVFLVRSAFIEAPGLLLSVAAIITAQSLFSLMVGLIIVIFSCSVLRGM
jgi:uncharacterized membrane protein